MRPVRLADSAHEDIEAQLDDGHRRRFLADDVAPALVHLATVDDVGALLDEHPPAHRYTAEGITVAGFHLFIAVDDLDPREDTLVVFAVDIWLDEFPD